jgi:ABC-2 type transport system ATP-binding protein
LLTIRPAYVAWPFGRPLPKSIRLSTKEGAEKVSRPRHQPSVVGIVDLVIKKASQKVHAPIRDRDETSDPARAAAIEMIGLCKRYDTNVAVEDLSFTASYGRIVGFLGPNGAGKTTTLRILLGLIRPTAGTTLIDGHPYADLADPIHTVGALLDGGASHPGRSGRNHLRILARAADIPEPRVEELLHLVGLKDAADRHAGTYSLGMRQRLGLAVALLGDPRVLVLDEPANGLDPEGIRWLRDLLRSLATEGRAVLVASHALAEVAQTVDDIVVVRSGRSVLQASLDQLLADHATGIRVVGRDAETLGVLLSAEGAHVAGLSLGTIVVRDRNEEQIQRVIAGRQLVISEILSLGSPLEEIYLELTATPNGGSL